MDLPWGGHMSGALWASEPGQPAASVFVIAEAGVNHNGDPALAHALIDLAADSGADAVKFQTFEPRALVAADAAAAPYQRDRGATTQLAMLERLTLPKDAWRELADHAAERAIAFLSTAFDSASLELVVDLGVQALKIPSGELDHLEFIAQVSALGLPVILSTGMGTLQEVETAVSAAGSAPSVCVLHCVTAYPAPLDQCNLRAIATMRSALAVPVGWSDHTAGNLSAIAALALGAVVLEKHITTDHTLEGPDHAASAGPAQFADYVACVRQTTSALGDGVKRPAEVELANLPHARRSFHVVRDTPAGTKLTHQDVALLRPASGLPPHAVVIGRVTGRPLAAGDPLCVSDLR